MFIWKESYKHYLTHWYEIGMIPLIHAAVIRYSFYVFIIFKIWFQRVVFTLQFRLKNSELSTVHSFSLDWLAVFLWFFNVHHQPLSLGQWMDSNQLYYMKLSCS